MAHDFICRGAEKCAPQPGMAAVPQEQYIDLGLFGVLNQSLGWMADTFLCNDLNTMLHTLTSCFVAQLFEKSVDALSLLIGFTRGARVSR